MDFDKKFAEVFARHRSDAVLLYRPYPPHQAGDTNSRFGGLPSLPPGTDWPRMADETPLHFLAQIDCRDIPFRSALPDRGMLFFFGRDDEEQIWNEAYVGDRAWRVIHAPDASGDDPRCAAPPDLLPVGGEHPYTSWYPFLIEGEVGPNVHIEWPIAMRRIDTWPDISAFNSQQEFCEPEGWHGRLRALIGQKQPARISSDEWARLQKAYDIALARKRADAFFAATGYTPAKSGALSYRQNMQIALRILREESGAHAYPDRWIYIRLFCRALCVALKDPGARQGIKDAEVRIAEAVKWIAIAEAADPAAPVPAADRETFRRWAVSMQRGEYVDPLDFDVADWIVASTQAVIRTFAHDRDQARLISPAVYDAMATYFKGESPSGVQYAQMLGHAASAQQAREVDNPTICLLNLASDFGLGWRFGDAGEASFWISPDALARRDFESAWATIEGH